MPIKFIMLTIVSVLQFQMIVDGVDKAAPPDLIVVGPIVAEEGDKIIVTAKSEEAATIDFTVIYNGEHTESVYEVIDCHCVSQSKPGKYIFLVKAIKDNKVNSFTHNLIVTPRGTKPEPPKPDDDKPIVIPDGFAGLTKWSFDKATELKVSKPTLVSYLVSLNKITDLTFNDVDTLNAKIRELNQVLTAEQKEKLRPLDNAIKDKLIELFKASTIDNVDSHKKAYKAIAEGLNYVK